VSHLRELRIAVPRLLATAGLTGAEVSYLGDTAIGLSLVDEARADLIRVAVAVGLVNLLLLILFLRALIAPLYLLASGVLAVGAALGLTSALFQDQLGQAGLIFYVPFAGWGPAGLPRQRLHPVQRQLRQGRGPATVAIPPRHRHP
jgi:RND superfamily putative drug exporter